VRRANLDAQQQLSALTRKITDGAGRIQRAR